MDHPDLVPAYQHYLKYAPYSTAFLYITTPQGDPVSNIMCDIEGQCVTYSMPCGLVPVLFVLENGLYAAPQQVALINPNAGEEIYERCIAELDPTAQKAYHLIWNGEPPDEYAKKADNYVTVSMKYEDGTPASGMFSFLCLIDTDPNFEGYPNTGTVVPPGGIPDGLIGTNGFRVAIERGRYADAEGNLHFVVGNSWKRGAETMHLSIDTYEIAFYLPGHGYHTPSIPAYDENGELLHSFEAVLTKPSGS
jgi:hypothetical protein